MIYIMLCPGQCTLCCGGRKVEGILGVMRYGIAIELCLSVSKGICSIIVYNNAAYKASLGFELKTELETTVSL